MPYTSRDGTRPHLSRGGCNRVTICYPSRIHTTPLRRACTYHPLTDRLPLFIPTFPRRTRTVRFFPSLRPRRSQRHSSSCVRCVVKVSPVPSRGACMHLLVTPCELESHTNRCLSSSCVRCVVKHTLRPVLVPHVNPSNVSHLESRHRGSLTVVSGPRRWDLRRHG